MNDIRFGRLVDLPLREAWRHEALQFTPWLAQNIDHLSEAIGIPLELTGTEVAVETFSADILARNPMDDSIVLIENQLETTDHTHLGRIMTYLAGLEAQTVVWIAPAFREPHLSAIRWLNEHTADGFSFFAVKARVVQIGDSPFAPIFEVIEKPNDWTRSIQEIAGPSRIALQPFRDRFWALWEKKNPDLSFERGGIYPYVYLDRAHDLYLSLAAVRTNVNCGIRSESAEQPHDLERLILKVLPNFEKRLGLARATNGMWAYSRSVRMDLTNDDTWEQAIDTMADHVRNILEAFKKVPAKP